MYYYTISDIRNFVFSSVGNNTNFDSLWTGRRLKILIKNGN